MEEPERSASPAAKKSNLPLYLGGLLIVTCAVGGGAWEFARHAKTPEKQKATAPEIKSVLHLENFVVNLADKEENRFLRIGIEIGLGERAEKSSESGVDSSVPRVRDAALAVLSRWRSETLLATEGKAKLKEELLQAFQQRVPGLNVREVYFTEFLVQQ